MLAKNLVSILLCFSSLVVVGVHAQNQAPNLAPSQALNQRTAAAEPVTVAAASDLKFALEDISQEYEKAQGKKLRLVFGSSGNFYMQMMQGAPFDIFMSADEELVFKLAAAGKTWPALDKGKIYAQGRIGIWVPNQSSVKADEGLHDLALALKEGRLQKFAIANPNHAPYGARAKQALQRAALWQDIEPKLVLGENISQAAQFAASGATQGGIIAQSLALAAAMQSKGRFALIPDSWYQPLLQRTVLIKRSGGTTDANPSADAKAFYDYLSSPSARQTLSRYGFTLPAVK